MARLDAKDVEREVYRIDIIESERGWGSKIDEIIYFDNYEEAAQYVKDYNSQNPPGPAPDWYMQAEGPYKI